MAATGLSSNPAQYRERLGQQTDDQLDAWSSELMRDVAARRGVVKVVEQVRKAARLDDPTFRRVFAVGGGAPQTVGHDAGGKLIVPATALHFVVAGLRSETDDARARLIEFLVAGYDEIVYV